MWTKNGCCHARQSERGVGLLLVAAGMVLFLAAAGLAIDLVAAYVARNEAQRAADAAALAGASVFVSQGCTTTGGCVSGGPQEALATTQADAVAGQNYVLGQSPTSSTVSTSFSYPNAEEPQITVTVYRDQAHNNPAPMFFATVFGYGTMDISASATAEAYNPSGGGTSVGTYCLKPFLVPNCDPQHPVPYSTSNTSVANINCPAADGTTATCPDGTTKNCCPVGAPNCQSYFFNPNVNGAIVNPGVYNPTTTPPSGGAVGEPWALHSEAGPSQWYLLGLGTVPNSGSQLRDYIKMCAPQVLACHNSLNTANGKKVGPTTQGIEALINANGLGLNQGQDSICSPTYNFNSPAPSNSPCSETLPFTILGGSNNPNGLSGKKFSSPSNSLISVAVYDGHQLPPGGSTVTIVGFMELFVADVVHNGPDNEIDTVILNIGGCGTSSSNPAPIVDVGGSFVPIRLIHQ